MNFSEFQQCREKILRERESVLDCAETNLYQALARLIPEATSPSQITVHRCHLAAEWVERFGLMSEISRRALVSSGVRDSLGQLFHHYAKGNARLWLPSDNYPIYGKLARIAGLRTREFPTLNGIVWPDAAPTDDMEILLVTNPLKPLGRWLTSQDVQYLEAWLGGGHRRRLLLDVVYTFETQFHRTTLRLLETEQTILLHSLTKGWLHPKLFGVALVPETDFATLAPVFRPQIASQSNLARARALLALHPEMPSAVAHALAIGRGALAAALPANVLLPTQVNAPGYFFPVGVQWQTLLDRDRILGLPASVFGSRCEDVTVLSSLKFTT